MFCIGYKRVELPSVYSITNTKHGMKYLELTQLFPVLLTRQFQIDM